MNSSEQNSNWITVGKIIYLIKKPLALYTGKIVEKLHSTLRSLLKGKCANHEKCKRKTAPKNLCRCCNQWYTELFKLHRTEDTKKINWRKNCDTSKWPTEPWEVAKFFTSVLGDNKEKLKDAESSDLSFLLNVLEWMNDAIFCPDKRVDLDLVRELRSKVRNPWAHAANQELTTDDLDNAFDIANKILAKLVSVFNCNEVTQCIEDIRLLKADEITSDIKAELDFLTLQYNELAANVVQKEKKLNQLEKNLFSYEKLLQDLKNRINQLEILYAQESEPAQIKNRIPDKPCMFIGRDAVVKKIISSLVENACGIVSIVGGQGFGKSSIAIEVCHHLRDNHDIRVIFSRLSDVSTVSDVYLLLCRDFKVKPFQKETPEESFTRWLKSMKQKVVLVMDNIEQLLEEKVRSNFTKLVSTLRDNSHQQLQILATTRTVFSILNQPIKNIQIEELDVKASVEILRKYCPNEKVEDSYLCTLANLCSFIPLALCITGSRIPRIDDPAELIQWLKEKPMKALQSTDKTQCVRKAIEFSFQMLSEKDKKAFVRLSVFNENFRKKSAQEVIERNGLETQNFLDQLVDCSLLKINIDKGYVIHLLIRQFLADQDQLQNEKAIAEALMVKHFLKLCHLWTIKSYSKDGFNDARKLLEKDAHNVEEMLKICSKRTTNLNPNRTINLNANVIEILASSDIYNFSSRCFFYFARYFLSQIVLRKFHESCLKLAESRKQVEIEITFRCLVAKQEGQKSAYKSLEYIVMMEAIKEAFDKNKEVLKADMSIYSYCYYFYARYYTSIETNEPCPDLQDDITLKPENMDRWSEVDEVLVRLERGYLNKMRAAKIKDDDITKYEEHMTNAESCCEQALSKAKKLLGEHELTCACYKWLGDFYLTWEKHEKAEKHYSNAIKLRKELKLDSNDSFVYLLKNYGLCFSCLRRFEESVKVLSEALDIADKLAEEDTPCKAQVTCKLAETYRDWKDDCQKASIKYAKVAMKMQKLLHSRDVGTLEDIIKPAEYNMR